MTEMLQKTENVANNIVNKNSQDLTSQWKKGELPEGFYYVKVKEEITNYPILADCVKRYEYYEEYTYFPEYEESITSVLAPVPSYEKWQASYNCMLENEVLRLKNAQLKELLKECKDVILDYNNWIMSASPKDSELMLRIDEVLNA